MIHSRRGWHSGRGMSAPRHRGLPLVSSFVPGMGTIGGMGSAGLAFASGLGGMGSADYSIAAGADVDPRFSGGEPGIYVVRMVVEAVKLTSETRSLHSTEPYNRALRAQGLNATVTNVRYAGNRNPRDSNWAGSLLDDVFGTGDGSDNVVADMLFDVTVRIDPMHADRGPGDAQDSVPYGMEGLGVVQIGAGAVFAIVAVIAVVLAVTFPGFGKLVLEGVSFIGKLPIALLSGAADEAAEHAIPLLVAAGVIAAAFFLFKKSGAKYSRGGFSLGG